MRGRQRRGLPIQDWEVTKESPSEMAKWLDEETKPSDLRACRNAHLDSDSLAVLGVVYAHDGKVRVFVCPDSPSMSRVLDKVTREGSIRWRVCYAYDVIQFCPYL